MSLPVVGASVAGLRTRAQESPNQDAWYARTGGAGTLAVVADGMGSRPAARAGAHAAVAACRAAWRHWSSSPLGSGGDFVRLIEVLWRLRLGRTPAGDAATTCLVCALRPDGSRGGAAARRRPAGDLRGARHVPGDDAGARGLRVDHDGAGHAARPAGLDHRAAGASGAGRGAAARDRRHLRYSLTGETRRPRRLDYERGRRRPPQAGDSGESYAPGQCLGTSTTRPWSRSGSRIDETLRHRRTTEKRRAEPRGDRRERRGPRAGVPPRAGGQGTVWLARGGRRVVKLLSRGGDREALRRRIAAVKRMDLRDLHVARPLALLRAPEVGYVAEFLDEMVPIGKLSRRPGGARGGLLRRERRAATPPAAARARGRGAPGLHARGLIYGDVSHHNVFVSAPVEACEAWLIDLDNLTPSAIPTAHSSRRATARRRSSRGGGADLALGRLGLRRARVPRAHAGPPAFGDAVADGEPELEEQAFAGRLPWIDHPTRQRTVERGLPRATSWGPLEQARAHHVRGGPLRPAKRPGLAAGSSDLHRVADQTVRCTGCGGSTSPAPRSARGAPRRGSRCCRSDPPVGAGEGSVDAMGALEKLRWRGSRSR